MPHLMLYNGRIMVPERARARIKEALHLAHLGETKTLALARTLYHWPGMVRDLKNMVWACEPCEKNRISKPNEPLLQTLDAWRPFQQISVDLAQLDGKHYLVLADRYSGWPEVKLLKHLDTSSIIKVLETIFETFGIPERIRTDGGPQFRREFASWCEELGMVHELTSPYRPESNGHAEQAVGAMKKLLKKTGSRRELGEALLEYRNAPRVGDELSFLSRRRCVIPQQAAVEALLPSSSSRDGVWIGLSDSGAEARCSGDDFTCTIVMLSRFVCCLSR